MDRMWKDTSSSFDDCPLGTSISCITISGYARLHRRAARGRLEARKCHEKKKGISSVGRISLA